MCHPPPIQRAILSVALSRYAVAMVLCVCVAQSNGIRQDQPPVDALPIPPSAKSRVGRVILPHCAWLLAILLSRSLTCPRSLSPVSYILPATFSPPCHLRSSHLQRLSKVADLRINCVRALPSPVLPVLRLPATTKTRCTCLREVCARRSPSSRNAHQC